MPAKNPTKADVKTGKDLALIKGGIGLRLLSFTKTELLTDPVYNPTQFPGAVVYCTNGSSNNPCLAYSNGTNWKIVAIGANVA